jgi:hypothetical protein
LKKSCHPSEAPTYPALVREKPESLKRQRALVLPSRQFLRGTRIVVFAAIAEMRCQERVKFHIVAGQAIADENDILVGIGKHFDEQGVAVAFVRDLR